MTRRTLFKGLLGAVTAIPVVKALIPKDEFKFIKMGGPVCKNDPFQFTPEPPAEWNWVTWWDAQGKKHYAQKINGEWHEKPYSRA